MWESLLPSLISAGANIFGGTMSAQGASQNNATQLQMANLNAQLQRETNAQNVSLFHENQDWQANMANTAYQRQMADMRAAGLNPILAYQKGGGASSPQISAPNLTAPSMGQPSLQNSQGEIGRAIGNAATSAVQTYKDTTAAELMKAQNKIADQTFIKSTHETDRAHWDALTAKQNARRAEYETDDYKKAGSSKIGGEAITAERIARRIADDLGIPLSSIMSTIHNAIGGTPNAN